MRNGLISGITVVALAAGVARPQTNDFYDVHATFPFAASQAVASDASSNTIFMGSGSGFMALDGTSTQPAPLTGSSIVDYRARCKGFVRDMVVTSTKLWVAAGVGGLQRWDRATNTQDLAFDLGEDLPNAWCLDVFHDSALNADIAIVGSNDHETSGKVYIVKVPASGSTVVTDSIQLATPVYAISATNGLVTDSLTVIVGKRCHPQFIIPVGPCDSLRRYDIAMTGSSPYTFPTTYSTPSWGTDCDDPVMIRDILIDKGVSPARAYVAASVHGIHAFSLAGGALTEITTGGWPISPTASRIHFDSIALFSDSTYRVLVAVVGGLFKSERQYWGELNVPFACDGGDDQTPLGQGLYVYDLTESPVSTNDGSIGVGSLPGEPLVASVRSQGSGNFLIDTACNTQSLSVVSASHSSTTGNWTLSVGGHWSDANSTTSEKVPGGSFDDVAVLDAPSGASASAYAYVTVESKLLAFEAPSTGAPLTNFSGITDSTSGAIVLARVSPAVSQPLTEIYSQVYVSAGSSECRFFDIASNPGQPVPSSGLLDTHGRSYCSFLTNGFDDDLILYVVNESDEDGGQGTGSCGDRNYNGGVRVFRMTDSTGSQISEPSTTATPQIGEWTQSICGDSSKLGTFLDAYVRTNGTAQDVWVTYGPKGAEEGNGLLALQATSDGSGGVSFSGDTKVPFETTLPSNASRLTFDSSRNLLYAAYGTAGLAMYDVSGSVPVEVGHFDFGIYEGHPMSALQLWPGPDNYVYVSLLGYGVGIIDASDGTSFANGFVLGSPFKLPGTCNAFADAPVVNDEIYQPKSAVYVADGAGGVHWIQFKVFN